ncbi:lipocalin/fatty-acid binding family protein [Streptomyces sp. NPDC003952]
MSIAGTYKMTTSTNFEEYLKAIGVGMATRKIIAASEPTVEIEQDGDNYKMKTTTTFKTIDLAFKLGEEFVEDTDDGRKCNTTVSGDGNVLVQVQKFDSVTATITRSFTADGFEARHEAAGIVAQRFFKRD